MNGTTTVLVVNNASFHRKIKLFPLTKAHVCHVIFLTPYSPELNPVEKFWNWLKRLLRKILAYLPSFDDALSGCF